MDSIQHGILSALKQGIEPDIEVTWTLEDVYDARDPDIIKAEAILLDARP